MSFDARTLTALLPAIYRIRDAELADGLNGLLSPAEDAEWRALEATVGSLTAEQQRTLQTLREKRTRGPLGALLAVIAEQVAVLEEDLEQLYDDQFIETCAEWAVPYIGDLIGYRLLHSVVPKVASPRAEVAHTIGFRRRKGTAAMLEQLARDVTGWDATVVEYFERLAATQYMNHRRQHIVYSADLRRSSALELIGSAFDRLPRSVEVRRLASGRGRYNIPNVGIHVWRLAAHTLTRSPAVQVAGARYRFHPLGIDFALITRPAEREPVTRLSEPIHVPGAIGRRQMARSVGDFYGDNGSLSIVIDDVPIDLSNILVCDLDDSGASWAQVADATRCIVDPALGRLLLPASAGAGAEVSVTFSYAFGGELGGGDYPRLESLGAASSGAGTVRVPNEVTTIGEALTRLGGSGVVEITDNGRYVENMNIDVSAGASVEIRAADGYRPTVVIDREVQLRGGFDAEIVLNGLLVTGHRLHVPPGPANGLARLFLRHCTLVPGWSLKPDGTPEHPDETSLVIESEDVAVSIDRCIVGALRAVPESEVSVRDSVVDATDRTAVAFAGPDGNGPGASLQVLETTLIGKVRTEILVLASNTIFFADLQVGDLWPAPVLATRRQQGCVRFSYVPPRSLVPRRYECQPTDDGAPIAPCFVSLRYGSAAYIQLSDRTPGAIRRGAADESEMGAFHHVHAPQRETNIRLRLDEYLRVGLEAGVIHAT